MILTHMRDQYCVLFNDFIGLTDYSLKGLFVLDIN